MAYEEKFDLASTALLNHCKKCVLDNHGRSFDMWLQMEAEHELGFGYQNAFKEQFGALINEEMSARLFFAGKNILYAINSFIKMKPNYELSELIKFVEEFISEQLNEFGNDYSDFDLYSHFTDEEGETNHEDETKEDNPS